jgi:hypothetical protein
MSSSSRTVAATSTILASTLMIMVAAVQLIQGLVAVVDGRTFFVSTPNYLLSFDATAWGWIHIIYGIVVGVAGYFVLTGNIVARTVGIILAAGQAVINFVWLPYYPIWGIIVIAIDVLVIWALATLRLDLAES